MTKLKEQIWMARGNAKLGIVKNRSIVRTRSHRLRNAVTSVIQFHSATKFPLKYKIAELRKDILNGPYHVFGEYQVGEVFFVSGTWPQVVKVLYYNIKGCSAGNL